MARVLLRMTPVMTHRNLASLLLALAMASAGACSGRTADERALGYAAKKLHADARSLRVTARTEMTTSRTEFFLVTRDGGAPMTVVVPDAGEPFDEHARGAFDRVARSEDTTRRLSQLGAERVALWFAALEPGTCGFPVSDRVHFVKSEVTESGVRLRYPFPVSGNSVRTCVIDLAQDGGLVRGHADETGATAHAQTRPWASDRLD
jgi:hypothetical protein